MIESQQVMRMMKRCFECKKYKKKFIESFIFYECDMFKVRVYFSFHYNKNVLRATSFFTASSPFFN